MKKEYKRESMDRTTDDLNRAKNCMARAAEDLERAGLLKDAEQLMNMVYRLEQFQNKYYR